MYELYKIKFDSHVGRGLFFVVEAKTPEEAKSKFYREMLTTDKIKSTPQKTTKKFIEGVKKIGNHWVVLSKSKK
jgi:hypothetical protein